MEPTSLAGNPFLMMLEPEAVLARVEKSERLGALKRQLCRPLDRVLPGTAPTTDPEEADAADRHG